MPKKKTYKPYKKVRPQRGPTLFDIFDQVRRPIDSLLDWASPNPPRPRALRPGDVIMLNSAPVVGTPILTPTATYVRVLENNVHTDGLKFEHYYTGECHPVDQTKDHYGILKPEQLERLDSWSPLEVKVLHHNMPVILSADAEDWHAEVYRLYIGQPEHGQDHAPNGRQCYLMEFGTNNFMTDPTDPEQKRLLLIRNAGDIRKASTQQLSNAMKRLATARSASSTPDDGPDV